MSEDQEQQDFLASELGVLVQDPPAPRGIDIAEAIRVGRRRRVRRRGAAAGGLALAITAAIAVGAIVSPASGADPATGMNHVVVDSRDPVTADADFGWLPAGVPWTTFASRPKATMGNEIIATGAHLGDSPAGMPTLTLYVYPKGIDPAKADEAISPWWTYKAAAPPVNGRTAYWLKSSNPGQTTAVLRWQAADGQWVELQAGGMATTTLTSDMLRTAAAVTVEEHSVPLPFTIQRLPGLGVFVASTALVQRDGRQVLDHSSIGFTLMDKQDTSPAYYLTVSPHTGAAAQSYPALGKEAIKNSGGFTKVCTTAHGLDACIEAPADLVSGNSPSNLAAIGGLKGLLSRVTLLGPDPRNWTTEMLR
jgi:hypothetical protein